MPAEVSGLLVNLLGFVTGTALYVMLLVMVWSSRRQHGRGPLIIDPGSRLPLATGVLGLAWNVGAFAAYDLPNLGAAEPPALVTAAAFTALGFLPAVVVHSVLAGGPRADRTRSQRTIVAIAYGLSSVAAVLNGLAALTAGLSPSQAALWLLTVGFCGLLAALLGVTRRQAGGRRTLWVVALAVFAVSAMHLGRHRGGDAWWVEMVGHHASLPLAFAILHQDYRFALADIFLKRALLLLMLVGVTLSVYALVTGPLLDWAGTGPALSAGAVALLTGASVAVALAAPALRRAADAIVDRLVLRRANCDELVAEVGRQIAARDSIEAVLDTVCSTLARALNARDVRWSIQEGASPIDAGAPLVVAGSDPWARLPRRDGTAGPPPAERRIRGATALAVVPTVEPPQYLLSIGALAAGRRLLSDDLRMLEQVAALTGRRIDAMRVALERYERTLREQEISRLASEAEVRAIRAQLNPHFLFNALTTIGYLIQTAPATAHETLMRLTSLLRGVLSRSNDEFTTLGDELDLVVAYLDIERARFEERLHTRVDVPDSLRSTRIPSLVLQPLVENAVKHGIAPLRAGGRVWISATAARTAAEAPAHPPAMLRLTVRDTGAGASAIALARGRRQGVGIASVERRLQCHYGAAAGLTIDTAPGKGMRVEVTMPLDPEAAAAGAAPMKDPAAAVPQETR